MSVRPDLQLDVHLSGLARAPGRAAVPARCSPARLLRLYRDADLLSVLLVGDLLGTQETCNGLDDDCDGIRDTSPVNCWREIYRFKTTASPLASRCAQRDHVLRRRQAAAVVLPRHGVQLRTSGIRGGVNNASPATPPCELADAVLPTRCSARS